MSVTSHSKILEYYLQKIDTELTYFYNSFKLDAFLDELLSYKYRIYNRRL